MTRSLDYRAEVLVPIFDRDAQDTIQNILDQQWHDNVKARVLDQDQDNEYVPAKKKRPGFDHKRVFTVSLQAVSCLDTPSRA